MSSGVRGAETCNQYAFVTKNIPNQERHEIIQCCLKVRSIQVLKLDKETSVEQISPKSYACLFIDWGKLSNVTNLCEAKEYEPLE